MKNIVLWSQDGCSVCEQVREALAGESIEVRDAARLIDGSEPNDEAMAQLAMQDFQIPVVQIDGVFVEAAEVLARAHGQAA